MLQTGLLTLRLSFYFATSYFPGPGLLINYWLYIEFYRVFNKLSLDLTFFKWMFDSIVFVLICTNGFTLMTLTGF
jgi:hypothetical protein